MARCLTSSPSVTRWYCIKMAEWYTGFPRRIIHCVIYKRIMMSPKIMVFPCGTLSQTLESSRFFCFLRHSTSTVASLSHRSPAFVCNTLTVTQSVAWSVRDDRRDLFTLVCPRISHRVNKKTSRTNSILLRLVVDSLYNKLYNRIHNKSIQLIVESGTASPQQIHNKSTDYNISTCRDCVQQIDAYNIPTTN